MVLRAEYRRVTFQKVAQSSHSHAPALSLAVRAYHNEMSREKMFYCKLLNVFLIPIMTSKRLNIKLTPSCSAQVDPDATGRCLDGEGQGGVLR